MMGIREASIERITGETNIKIKLVLNGEGKLLGATGVGFFDHMMELFARHSGVDLHMDVAGDTYVDYHHLIEDIGICLGICIKKALGDKKGINRYGSSYVPMDEALVRSVVDCSGRPSFVYLVTGLKSKVGGFDTELIEEFLRALANNGGITMHIELLYGSNTHHCLEAVFKALSRSLSEAWTQNPNLSDVLSTKGVLD